MIFYYISMFYIGSTVLLAAAEQRQLLALCSESTMMLAATGLLGLIKVIKMMMKCLYVENILLTKHLLHR